MLRVSPSGFFGPSRCLVPTPVLTLNTPSVCVCVYTLIQCVCVCVYTRIHAHTLTHRGEEKKIGPRNKKERTERKTPRGVIAQCFLGLYYSPYPWDAHNQFSIKTLLSKQIRHACHFHKWKCKRLVLGPLTSLVQSRVLLQWGFLVF